MENGATLYSGGRVLVLDGVTPPQEALVVRDGRVAGVGDAGDMTRLAGKGAGASRSAARRSCRV